MAPISGMGSLLRLRTFSLRTGLGLFLVLGAGFGMAARWYHHVRKVGDTQLWLVETDRKLKVTSRFFPRPKVYQYAPEGSVSMWTEFVRARVHPEYARKLELINIPCRELEAATNIDLTLLNGIEDVRLHNPQRQSSLEMAFGIPGITSFTVWRSEVEFKDQQTWRNVRRAANLEVIEFHDSTLSCGLAEELARLPKLSQVYFDGSIEPGALPILCRAKHLSLFKVELEADIEFDQRKIDEEQEREIVQQVFDELAKRQDLKEVLISNRFPIEPSMLKEFCSKSGVQWICLWRTGLKPECLKELARLPHLAQLDLNDSQILDEHLEWLVESRSLRSLRIGAGPQNSAEAILALSKKMPQCEIVRY